MPLKKIFPIFLLLLISIFSSANLTAAQNSRDFVLLIRMMGIQDSWFREQIVKPFETLHDTDITVTSFDRFWDLEVMLALDKKRKKHTIGLVKTPLEMTRTLKD
ncbi:MAG: hypothetical protein M0P57_08370, partial [Syntrophales bacterium]|nr:hypothetical protein [Syntrophales bacterium]